MGIWQRIKTVMSSTSTPDELGSLDETYREQTQLLTQVHRSVADLTTSRRRIELQITKLGEGNDALRKELERHHAQLIEDEQLLVRRAEELQAQIETFRVRKDTAKARRTAAEARLQARDAFSGISGPTNEALARAERHTAEIEATADAFDELRQNVDDETDFDRQMAEIESNSDGKDQISQ